MKSRITIHLVALLALILVASCGDGQGEEDLSNPFEPPVGGTSSATCDNDNDIGYYEMEFATDWLAANFESYPPNPHFAMFTLATHDENVTFWEVGGMASPGIEKMAEDGLNQTFSNEVTAQIALGNARTQKSGNSLFISGTPTSRTITFGIWGSHPLVTVVSMIAPTPDWFVGVNGIDLCGAGGWEAVVAMDAFVHDAGTEMGTDWSLSNDPENPYLPIAQIPGAPFRDMVGGTLRRVGTFTFTRQ